MRNGFRLGAFGQEPQFDMQSFDSDKLERLAIEGRQLTELLTAFSAESKKLLELS
jgi:hypothetical protein